MSDTGMDDMVEGQDTSVTPASMFAHHPHAVALMGPDGTVRATNFGMDQLLGCEPGGSVGLSMLDLVASRDTHRVRTALARAARLERVPDFGLTLELPSGTKTSAIATVSPADPVADGVFLALRDPEQSSSPVRQDQLAPAERNSHLQAAILDSLPAHVALLDSAGRITAVNEAWKRFGRENGLDDAAHCVGEDYLAVCRAAAADSPEAAAVLAALQEILQGSRRSFEIEYPCHGSFRRWFRVHVSSVQSPLPIGAVVMHVNVTEQHLAAEKAQLAARALRQLSKAALSAETEYRQKLDHVARHDALTGLANRLALESFTQEATSTGAGQPGVCTLMLINIDGFRLVNESLGHARADAVLVQIAQRLREVAPPGEMVARLGADEFAIMFAGLPDAAAAHAHATRICDRVSNPILSESDTLSLTVSIGFSCYPDDGEDFEELLRAATMALREAKKGGRSRIRAYERRMSGGIAAEWSLRREMSAAIRAGQFAVFYQPAIHIGTGNPCSVEALVRWRHPERGLLTPDKFIPLAEESGAIVELGDWVLRRACEDAVRLRAASGSPIRIAVNLSARQFECADLSAKVARAVSASGLAPADLRLEITESTVMADPRASCSILSNLASMGVSLALDDFGTGYSSLGYLQKFPLTCLKIDRSFVAGLPDCGRSAAIARILVLLGKSLQMSIVAEGVENRAQLEFLRACGCDEVQGYLFANALPYEEAAKWLAARNYV